MKKYRFLLAADPSLDGWGYCVLDCKGKKPKIAEVGTVLGRTKTWSGNNTQDKLAMISAKAKELRAKYNPLYPTVFFERGFAKFKGETQAIYRARGAFESELVGYEITEYPPSQVKLEVTGNGHASKEEVLESVAKIFDVPKHMFKNDNESDAAAVAYVGYTREFRKEI